MAEQRSYDWKENLGREEGISRLIRALALSDRFHVYLLMCDTPRIAQAVFELLPARVAEEREEPVRLVRLDPYEGRNDPGKPIAFARLAESVLRRLVSPAAEERDDDVIFVVDGSNALPQDDEAWAVLFQRMNERRNVIAGVLRGALVVCVPRRLEPVFAHAAPDFWSIRSLAVVVEGRPPRETGLLEVRERGPAGRYGKVEAEEGGQAAEIEAGIAAARESLAKAPDDDAALGALLVWLDRRVEHELERGAVDRALQAAEENVALVWGRMERGPNRAEWLNNRAVSFDKVGAVHEVRGDLTAAHKFYDESLRLRRDLLKREPDRAEVLHDLSVSLNKVGEMCELQGDLRLAYKAYDESVRTMRALVEQNPDQAELLHVLSVSLENIGDVYMAQADISAAYKAYDESFRIRQGLLEREPDRAEWLSDVSTSLGRAGAVNEARGDLTLAHKAYHESILIWRRLLERDPDRTEWLFALSVTLDNIGDVQMVRGDLGAAHESYIESLHVRQRLLEKDPTRPSFRHNLVLSVVRQARIAEAMGSLNDALVFWRQALAELESLSRRESPLPLWATQAALARKAVTRLENLASKPKRRKKKR